MTDARTARLRVLLENAVNARSVGNLADAARIANDASSEGFAHPMLLRFRAESLRKAGRFAEAGELLNQALALAPRDDATITEIGRLLMAEDRSDDALEAFRMAVSLNSASLESWSALGAALAGRGELEKARIAFLRVVDLSPSDPDPLASLAFIETREGRMDAARAWAEKALVLQPGHPLAGLALARIEVDGGQFESARDRLQNLLDADSLNRAQRQIAMNLLGDSLDGLEQHAGAFAIYARMKAEFVATHSKRYGDGGSVENHVAFIRRLQDWFASQDMADWSCNSSRYVSPVRRHVFLLGYLRSGVTLVESVLASLAGTVVVEEGATLAVADLAFLRDADSLSRLNPLDQGLAEQARAAYWKRAREEAGEIGERTFVDMSPLYGIKLPMIARLFPDAIVVQCRRDPRDVVLSCFRRNFNPNALTYQLTSLEGIARHYDAAMKATEFNLNRLGLPVHVVEYSRMVGDFDAATHALAEFVGVPWSNDVRNFSATAARRRIRTPSASQVRRGLFDGSGQWRKYSAEMAPVMPVLEPWVRKFGYDEHN